MHRNKTARMLTVGLLCLLLLGGGTALIAPESFGLARNRNTAATEESKQHGRYGVLGNSQSNTDGSGSRTPCGNSPRSATTEQTGGKPVKPESPLPEPKRKPVRWVPENLNWDPSISVAPKDAVPEADKYAEKKTDWWKLPPNTIALSVYCVDAVSGESVEDAQAEVLDSSGRFRATGAVKPIGWFLLSYSPNSFFIIRTRTADMVGYATAGIGAGAIPTETKRHAAPDCVVYLKVEVAMISRNPAHARVGIRVRDKQGNPLAGAAAYWEESILGQSGDDGVISIPAIARQESRAWVDKVRITVQHPGKVPVFVKPEDLVVGEINDVVLRANEIVAEFSMLLPASILLRPTDSYAGGGWPLADRSVVPDGIDLRDAASRMLWKAAGWKYSGCFDMGLDRDKPLDNRKVLSEALGRGVDAVTGVYYDRWYTNQWSYDDGRWRVVLPHAGKFIVTINEARRPVTDPYGNNHPAESRIFPGLALDATDPANPKVDLIYAP